MRQTQEKIERIVSELTAEHEELNESERMLDEALKAAGELSEMLEDAPGPVREFLGTLRERLQNVRQRCAQSWVARLERLRTLAESMAEETGHIVSMANLGELSASVAHEIRNPLCGMLLSVEVLQTKMDAEDSRTVLLHNIHREAERMEKVVNNLLHFSRNYKPRPSRCRLDDLVRRAADSIKRHISRKSIEVVVHSEPAGPVHVDADLFNQVLRNLLMNAVDASPNGSAIDVRFDADAAGRAVLNLVDHGTGIAPENVKRIFDPFYTSKHNGVGLGLSVTRKIVEAHGGEITVESAPGQGTTFTIVMPVAQTPKPAGARS